VLALFSEPPAAIVPSAAFLPPAMPFTLQVTLVDALPAPVTVAVKSCAPPAGTVAVSGETLTAIEFGDWGVDVVAEPVEPATVCPHAARSKAGPSRIRLQFLPRLISAMLRLAQDVCHDGAVVRENFADARIAASIDLTSIVYLQLR